MPPLFAFKPGPNYQWSMTVGPVTLSWYQWFDLLLCTAITLSVASWILTLRSGRWYLSAGITLLTAAIAFGSSWRGAPPHCVFEEARNWFVLLLPLALVHAVLAFTIPKRKQPFDDWPDSWEPASRFDPHQTR